MKEVPGVVPPTPAFLSRRRAPRVEIPNSVSVRNLSLGGPLVLSLRDVSFGGFGMETADRIANGVRARFEFSSLDGLRCVADAMSVHCHKSPEDDTRWISGWKFVEQPGVNEAIGRLLDAAVGVLSID